MSSRLLCFILPLAISCASCASTSTNEVALEKVESISVPLKVVSEPDKTIEVDYLYVHTAIKEKLLDPPVYRATENPSNHTKYGNAMDPYTARLLDYRDYIENHLLDISKQEPYLNDRLMERIKCVEYHNYLEGIAGEPERVNLEDAGITSTESLNILLSRYIQQQRKYIQVLHKKLLEIDKRQQLCFM